MIYFIRALASGHIKIGHTFKIHQRMGTLKAQVGPIELLGVMFGGYFDERFLHNQFVYINVPDRTYGEEWFFPTRELLDYIGENAISIDEHDAMVHECNSRHYAFMKTGLYMRHVTADLLRTFISKLSIPSESKLKTETMIQFVENNLWHPEDLRDAFALLAPKFTMAPDFAFDGVDSDALEALEKVLKRYIFLNTVQTPALAARKRRTGKVNKG